MKSQDYFQLFLDTGAPEMYLFYQRSRRMEQNHVLDDPSDCPEGNRLQ